MKNYSKSPESPELNLLSNIKRMRNTKINIHYSTYQVVIPAGNLNYF